MFNDLSLDQTVGDEENHSIELSDETQVEPRRSNTVWSEVTTDDPIEQDTTLQPDGTTDVAETTHMNNSDDPTTEGTTLLLRLMKNSEGIEDQVTIRLTSQEDTVMVDDPTIYPIESTSSVYADESLIYSLSTLASTSATTTTLLESPTTTKTELPTSKQYSSIITTSRKFN